MTETTKLCPFCAEEIKAAAIVCKHCGKAVGEPAAPPAPLEHVFELGRCTRCDVSSTNAMKYRIQCKAILPPKETDPKTEPKPVAPTQPSEPQLSCPKCRSNQITAQKQGFGLGKAVAGGVLTGGVGLLVGFLGSGKVKVTCLRCGHSWKPGTKAGR